MALVLVLVVDLPPLLLSQSRAWAVAIVVSLMSAILLFRTYMNTGWLVLGAAAADGFRWALLGG